MDHLFRFWARAAGASPIGMGIRGSIYLRAVDCRRLCMLGVWHAARQYGDACIGLVCEPILSTALGTVLPGVALGAPFWVGVILVVAGSLINVWIDKRATKHTA